jgi:soluble lytic murein transglycosylase-like protein
MKKMGLSLDNFDAWMAEHCESAIKHIKYMPPSMQKDVASIALFIRKSNYRIDAKTAWREAAALVHYSGKYGVPSVLTTAVAAAESTFNPNALSSKGASGVMQVMWNIHNGLLQSNGIRAAPGKNPLADPEHAIAAGCLLLSRYIRASGSVQKAMDRYYGASSANYRRKINVNIAKLMTHRSGLFD